jgi:FkbM family methyltransferase
MMIEKKFRSVLLKVLGIEKYLELVSSTYIRLIGLGMMKKKYPELFYLNQLIQPGFVCIDIGANVGYYAVLLSKLSGKSGHVYAVEPVPLFSRIFLKNVGKFALNNITLYQCALGPEEKEITLETPIMDGVFRHGLTKIVATQSNNAVQYKAQMLVPDKLFKDLTRLDYIKCDVEGYETELMPQMLQTIEHFKPTIQIELSSTENKQMIYELFAQLGYTAFVLNETALLPLTHEAYMADNSGDYYFKVIA